MTKNEMNIVFKDYPDALTLGEFSKMLGISQKLASKLIRTGEIEAIKVGREYRIAKVNAIRYLLGEQVMGKYVLNETSNPKCWTIRGLCGIVGATKKNLKRRCLNGKEEWFCADGERARKERQALPCLSALRSHKASGKAQVEKHGALRG